METLLRVEILPQPDDTTCGPTCLHAVYRFLGDDIELTEVIAQTSRLESGGTLAVLLGCHALSRGYQARIYTYNLQVFDPTWFKPQAVDLAERLRSQMKRKSQEKLGIASRAYLEFLALGGQLRFEDLTRRLIRKYLDRGVPILTGLSATYLYHACREIESGSQADDLGGEPVGHFVVLCGYDRNERTVLIADPLHPNPTSKVSPYAVHIDRVIGSILLGIVTYDANLLIIHPDRSSLEEGSHGDSSRS